MTVYRSPRVTWYFVAHPSAREPGRWQLTCMGEDGIPTGHGTFDTEEEAGMSACGRFVWGEPPYGDRWFRRVEE